jgi:hypothetical protein
MTLEERTAQRDAPLAARHRGVRTVEIEGAGSPIKAMPEAGEGIRMIARELHVGVGTVIRILDETLEAAAV